MRTDKCKSARLPFVHCIHSPQNVTCKLMEEDAPANIFWIDYCLQMHSPDQFLGSEMKFINSNFSLTCTRWPLHLFRIFFLPSLSLSASWSSSNVFIAPVSFFSSTSWFAGLFLLFFRPLDICTTRFERLGQINLNPEIVAAVFFSAKSVLLRPPCSSSFVHLFFLNVEKFSFTRCSFFHFSSHTAGLWWS